MVKPIDDHFETRGVVAASIVCRQQLECCVERDLACVLGASTVASMVASTVASMAASTCTVASRVQEGDCVSV